MSIKILIASSLLLLTLITMNCPAPDWSNPGVQSADQLISGGTGVIGPSLTSQAQAAREAEMGQSGKEVLSEPSGSELSSGASTPQQARNADQNTTTATESNAAEESAAALTTSSTQPAAFFGNWSLELKDSEPHEASLTIFQDEDAVYGIGIINQNAGNAVTSTASGTVTGQEVSLDLVSVEKVSLYRISMTISGNSASGNYVAFSPGEASITGTVKGVRAAPLS